MVIGDTMKNFKNSKCAQKSKLDEATSCPCLPPVSAYISLQYTTIPVKLRGLKNLVGSLSEIKMR